MVLLVGSNIRWEAPLIATRVRKVARKGGKVFAIGPEVDLGMKVEWIGNDLKLLGDLPKAVSEAFAKAERPAVIVGPGALAAGGLGAALALVEPLGLIRDGWNGFNVLHISASRMASLILGYAQPGGIADIEAAAPELVLLLGADEMPADRFKGAYKVYIGHHGDAGAKQADLVLPGAAYAEKHGTYVNTEGRVQRGERALFAPGEAREDWAILRAVSELAGAKLPFDSFAQLRAAMVEEFPQLGREGLIDLKWAPPKLDAKAEGPVRYPIGDFFLTNAICRASPTMQRCSEELVQGVAVQGGGGVTGCVASSIGALRVRLGVVPRHDHRHPPDRPAADAGGGDDHLRRAQDLGGDGASARAQRGRAVGPAAELRRRTEGLPQGNHHPDQREQGPVPDRADRHLHRRADRVGGDPVPAGRGARRHQCRPALRPRGELARSLRRDRRGLGVQLQISVLLGAPGGGADGELRSVDRLRADHASCSTPTAST